MVKINKNGKKYYYYYKKKIGRHKKTGKKKQLKKRGRSWQKPWNFKIVKCTFNKQDEFIGVYHDEYEIEKVKQILLDENKKIIFPQKFVNTTKIKNDTYNQTEFKTEFLFLERINDENCDIPVKLRDNYGRFIDQTTNSEKWKIYDKIPYVKEETFWVYGYNPHNNRKTFMWIYENLLVNKFENNNLLIIQIFVYKNKVIITHDSELANFIICKNQSDSIRLYNKLNEYIENNKVKRCYFMGQVTSYDYRGKSILNKIHELTGWEYTKIRQSYT